MKSRLLASAAVAGVLLVVGATSASADPMDSNPCAVIATAKFQQWRQPKLMVERTKTFSDGRMVNDKLIVTENTAYHETRNQGWTSAGITLRERAVANPSHILKDMGLGECTKAGSEDIGGLPATIYEITYLPDQNGFVAHSRVWIADQTGLPMREELHESAPPANMAVATAISATYRYNADVSVPRAAEVAEARRLVNNAAVVRNMQSGGMGVGGPQQ